MSTPSSPASGRKSPWLAVASVIGVIAYPLLVYVALDRFEVRWIGLGLAAIALLGVARRVRSADGRFPLLALAPLAPAVLLGLGASATEDPRLILGVPVFVNLGLLVGFASTLRAGRTPMIERFARLVDPELPPGGEAHCRAVTFVWVGFFAMNAAVCAALSLWAPLTWWTLYTGLLAYVAMGLVFTIEFIVRKAKFRRYGQGLLDRLCCRIFPPREGDA